MTFDPQLRRTIPLVKNPEVTISGSDLQKLVEKGALFYGVTDTCKQVIWNGIVFSADRRDWLINNLYAAQRYCTDPDSYENIQKEINRLLKEKDQLNGDISASSI